MILYICDTPYQILNVLNLALHETEKSDIYIVKQFRGYEKIAEHIIKDGIFSNVFLVEIDKSRTLKKGIKRSLFVMYDYLHPKRYLKKVAIGDAVKRVDSYTRVYASCMSAVVSAVAKVNKNAELIFYEDGISSYYGNIAMNSNGKLNHLFCKLFSCGVYAKKIDKLLVNRVDICEATGFSSISMLPQKNDRFFELASRIFDSPDSRVNTNKKIIWLTQPDDGIPGYFDSRNAIKEVLINYKQSVLVRLHPRDRDYGYYKDFEIDKSEEIWELKIHDFNLDELILIADFSSALWTPKMWYDKEPTLIFLFGINSEIHSSDLKNEKYMYEKIKNSYINKDRVILIEETEQLKNILSDKILSKD